MKTPVARSLLEQLRDFDTALLANTIGYIDPTPPHEYYMAGTIQSVTRSLGPTVGIALTCELDSSTPFGTPDLSGYWKQVEEMSRMSVPTVWVVKCVGSRPEHECVIGDGMGKTLFAAGCVGVVTDGGVRDISGLLSVPFAAYSKGVTIHHGPLRFRRTNEPIEIGGITVRPGDVIHANGEGVIRIPSACLEKLPEAAIRMRAFEHAAHLINRRTDLPIPEKQRLVVAEVTKYGFADCVTVPAKK
jgi:regulator of RNase E activity RraA